MRTNIVLNDQLVQEAFRYTSVTTKRELVELALQEFVQNHKRHDIRDLRNSIKIDPNYAYKKMREGK